jgi:uncharacterized protein involved in exopolysaccharide biosynthesis
VTNDQKLDPSMPAVVLLCLRRRRLILGVAAAAVVAGAAWVVLAPVSYRARAKVLITTNQVNISSSADRSTEFLRRTTLSPEELNSQIEILRSATLVKGVLDDMAAHAPGGAGRATEGSVADVLGAVDAAIVGRSNVIEISFTGRDPARTRDFVNRLTAAYVDRHARLQQSRDAEDFFTRQSDVLWRKVMESESALRELRRRSGVLPGYHEDVRGRLSEFGAELTRTRVAVEEQGHLVEFLEAVARDAGPANWMAAPQVLGLEAKRAEILGRYQPGSARVKEVDSQLETLRGVLASYEAVGGSQATDVRGAQARLAALEAREVALTKRVAAYEREAEAIAAQGLELARVERQLNLDEEAYLSYIRSAEESRLSNALQQSSLLRLRIIEPAVLPLQPVTPHAARVVLFGLAGGLVFGFGAAVARDRFDQSIRTAGDVRRWASLEVLAVLPERA